MKVKSIILLTVTVFMLMGCVQSNKHSEETAVAQYVQSEFTETFESVGFSITTPCILKDVSAEASGNFLINYGGIENPNDERAMAVYQVIVTRLPVGNRNLSKAQLDNFLDKVLQRAASNLSNVEKVKFGYECYPGYVGYASKNGLRQKGVMFVKGDYVIGLTLMTNDNLETRFNKFTNGFKTLSNKVVKPKSDSQLTNSKSKTYPNLPQLYSNSDFSLYYPKSWSIVQENAKANAHITIAIQVMAQNVKDYEFAPNVNVIVSQDKHSESTDVLARISFKQLKDAGIPCKLIGITPCNLNGCRGSVVEYTAKIQGFTLRILQYIVKKSNNKTFTVTATIDNAKLSTQKNTAQKIVNTFTAQ